MCLTKWLLIHLCIVPPVSSLNLSLYINITNQYMFCDSILVITDKAFVQPALDKQLQGLYLIKVLK